uniref:Uncharacterized protein n=1 Tax=Lepeophtheirus salmonis TaxID=72036 RepID=A0A0K2SZX2_LEPSM
MSDGGVGSGYVFSTCSSNKETAPLDCQYYN